MKACTLLTVIISFYNVEKHIVSGSKDLKAQINADFQFILVDNGFLNKSHEYDSFHSFGQLIFPNKKNPFQWNRLHFDEWHDITAEREVFIPVKTHPLVRLYIVLIKARHDRAAKNAWNMLRFREKTK